MVEMVVASGAAGVLVGVAALHVYWGFGGRWPAKDERGLVERVVGASPEGKMPGLLACLVVGASLTMAAVVVLAASDVLAIPGPSWLLRLGVLGVVAVLALRGIGGFVDHRLRPQIVGTPYDRLNRRFYSPLCLGLATAIAFASGLL